jgi:HEAT repeat protein
LGNIEDPSGGDAALSALSDEDLSVRRMAVGAVSALRYEKARPALQKNMEDPDRALRYDSAVALARLKDPQAVPVLLEMMGLKAEGKDSDILIHSAKLAALDAYRELPDTRLRAKVTELSQDDPDLKVRDAAMKALKK